MSRDSPRASWPTTSRPRVTPTSCWSRPAPTRPRRARARRRARPPPTATVASRATSTTGTTTASERPTAAMTHYVALLRGVNVGGVTIKMADLAEVVRELGYTDVKTVLASGNVLFTTRDAASTVKQTLESALRTRFGYEAWVHVLTVEAIRAIVAAYPYPRSGTRHA